MVIGCCQAAGIQLAEKKHVEGKSGFGAGKHHSCGNI